MKKSKQNIKEKRKGKKRSKGRWIVQRIFSILCLFVSIGILVNGWFLLRDSWLEGAEKDFSEANVIQKYKKEDIGSNKDKKKNSTGDSDKVNKETKNAKEEIDYPELCGLPEVDKPVERSFPEILERLKALAKDNQIIARIYKNYQYYPEKLLEALANNPEMADFTEKYLSNNGIVSNSLTASELAQKYPLFLQWDPRWGYAGYGDNSCIGLSGCGPTCLSMVLYYLTGDTALTPDKIAAYSAENGYYVPGTGTAWALLEDFPAKYHIGVRQLGLSEEGIKAELDKGHMIICVMGAGDFTVAGHFIVIYGYDKHGFMINDPNCVARSKKQWKFTELEEQIKNIWTYWEEETAEEVLQFHCVE